MTAYALHVHLTGIAHPLTLRFVTHDRAMEVVQDINDMASGAAQPHPVTDDEGWTLWFRVKQLDAIMLAPSGGA